MLEKQFYKEYMILFVPNKAKFEVNRHEKHMYALIT